MTPATVTPTALYVTAGILGTIAIVAAGVAIWAWIYGDSTWKAER